jgi:hypothetical protein
MKFAHFEENKGPKGLLKHIEFGRVFAILMKQF